MFENNEKIDRILYNYKKYPHNPSLIQRAVFDHLERVTEGSVDTINATNPFVFALETSAVLTAGFSSYSYDLNRKQYPSAAMTDEDLYRHMSDKDYINFYAYPTHAKFTFIFDADELSRKMVYDSKLGVKKLVIPRNTFITVGSVITFTMEYPVEIRELPHGGIQVLTDASRKSPIQTLKTNMIDFEITRQIDANHDREMKWLLFDVDVMQVVLNSFEYPSSRGSKFDVKINLVDSFYYCRVFYQDNFSVWREMKIEHSPDIYDVSSPTAVVRLMNGYVTVTIPQVYADRGYLDSKIRVDVYETKGYVNIDLGGYDLEEFKITFRAIDTKLDDTSFSAAIPHLNIVRCFSKDLVNGGRGELSFKERRERVIENSVGIRKIPTSNIQIETHLEDEGFTIIRDIDNVTNRAYLASRGLPKPQDERLITSAASSIETLNTTIGLLNATGYAYENFSSITINPEAVYEIKNGLVRIVPREEVESLNNLPIEERVIKVNSSNYFRSPFHYVLDMSHQVFDLRPYYLDKPEVTNKSFVDSNDTTNLLQVTIDSFSISRTTQGYKLIILTKSDTSFKDIPDDKVFVQLAYKPPLEIDYAYLNGKFLGREVNGSRIYRFDINTNYNLTKNHELELVNFKMYNKDDRIVKCPLLQDFDVIFSTNEPLVKTWRSSPIDKKLGKFLLPKDTKAVVNEKIRVRLGYSLDNLWTRVRSIGSEGLYERYGQDVYATYEEDILDTDAKTFSALSVDGSNHVSYKFKHRKGDLVLDKSNNPIVIHKKGDLVLDDRYRPMMKDKRQIVVSMDIMLVEWVYFLANHPTIQQYRENMFKTYVSWIVNSLSDINSRVLEQTKVYFFPRATLGLVSVMYNGGIVTKINAAQSLILDLVVRPQVYANLEIREEIRNSTVKAINTSLEEGVLSTNGILTKLTELYGYDVIGVRLSGLGHDDDIITMSILEDGKRCSLKKRLTLESNNTLFVEEDVTINFVEHVKKDED